MVRALLQLTKKLIEHVKREYARFTSLEDEGDTIKWRKYKSFYFINYSIVFLLSRFFFKYSIPFFNRNTAPNISCISAIELRDEVNSGEIRRSARHSGYDNYLFLLQYVKVNLVGKKEGN